MRVWAPLALGALRAPGVGAGPLRWYDARESLHFGASPGTQVTEAHDLGAWAARLGAPAARGGADAGLPVSDFFTPLLRLTLLVVPADAHDAAQDKGDTSVRGTVAELGAGLRSARRTLMACVGATVCGPANRPVATSMASRAALAEVVEAAGGSVEERRVRGTKGAPWLPLDQAGLAFFAELAALVAVAAETEEASRVDILFCSKFGGLDADHRPAALALVHLAAEHIQASQTAALAFIDASGPLLDAPYREDVSLETARRRLEATPAPTSVNATYYSLDEIRAYQLNMWTGIVLVVVLCTAIMMMVTMKPEYDSLLYATFQANVNTPIGKLD